ncbi:MAG: Rpn family recombination-promoting nuclease/putative transposase [Treponemataceae bacterium]|nr:Rpn family recombination-promoting nuclease/putative transposase [Treponemataceae bacterium]
MGNENENLTPEEKWERATLANNFIFYKVMRHHPDACKHLLEMLLNIKIENMEISNEEVIDVDYDAKAIRLDVFVKDTNQMFDIEIQVTNTRELPERARYYQGLMDLDTLKSGQHYKDLNDSHVIFICMENVFDNDLPVSTFENICIEDVETKLNDRAYKHFFIAPTCAKMIEDEETRDFFEFLISNTAKSDFTSELKDYVADAKHNMQWRAQYMTWEMESLRLKAEGAHEKAIENGQKMLKKNYPIQEISEITGLPLEEVLNLQAELNK